MDCLIRHHWLALNYEHVYIYLRCSKISPVSLFHTHIQFRISHAIGNALLGGSAEYIALRFKKYRYESLFYFSMIIVIITAFIALLCVPNMRKGRYL